jgi:hypothetical protein
MTLEGGEVLLLIVRFVLLPQPVDDVKPFVGELA